MAVLVVHAVLLPLLSYGMIVVVRNVQEEVFIDHVRIYSSVFADMLQSDGHLADDRENRRGAGQCNPWRPQRACCIPGRRPETAEFNNERG